MPINTAYLAADFAAAIVELPVTASYNGALVSGLIESTKREDGLEMTGTTNPRSSQLFIPATATLPAERSRLDIQHAPGGTYEAWRVMGTETSPDRIHHTITLERWSRAT